MPYTTIDNPELFFQNKIYTGNGGTNAITLDGSENMQPDWVWIKDRDTSGNSHILVDSVRGASKNIHSNLTNAESTKTDRVVSFDSNGFTLGADSSQGANDNGSSQVAWNWKAGTSFSNDASATGVGTIDSSGSVSTDAGFGIISYTGTGSAGTIAHGLGLEPKIVITRNRDTATNWCVYSSPVGNTKSLFLNLNNASDTATQYWNDTTPTSSVFSVGSNTGTNKSGDDFISYCFAEKKSYSKFGTYTGNGNADGTFVYTGFRPAWVMLKRTDTAKDWLILDNKRNTDDNPYNTELVANSSNAEATSVRFDNLSNGFKLRLGSGASNASGATYIYMAFAESPFVNSSGVPNNAR